MSTPITPELVDAYRDDLLRLAGDRRDEPATTRRWFRRGRRTH